MSSHACRIAGAICVGWLFLQSSMVTAAERQPKLRVPNGGFEEGLRGWTIPAGEGMTTLAEGEAASGKRSLHVRDTRTDKGSEANGSPIAVRGGLAYSLRGKAKVAQGSGLGVYLRFLDRRGQLIPSEQAVSPRPVEGSWESFEKTIFLPEEVAAVFIQVHSFDSATVDAYLDDLELVIPSADSPWEPQYKIDPREKERLTEADVVGPDGIVYPDWSRCGVQGGIPSPPVVARVEDYDAVADDGRDDSSALDRACVAAGEKGGGVVLLGKGTYHLDWPVTIRHSGVVIRGQGATRTTISFRYTIPEPGVSFYDLKPGSRVGKQTNVHLHCLPTGLMAMRLLLDGREVHVWQRGDHWGNTFSATLRGDALVGSAPDGAHTLTGVAEYDDGRKRQQKLPIVLDSGYRDDRLVPSPRAAILFEGRGETGPRRQLAEDGVRGSRRLMLSTTGGVSEGDPIYIEARSTERWQKLIGTSCQGLPRAYMVRVSAVSGNEIELEQPLRIDFPVVDGAFVSRLEPIERCGVEDLTIEHSEDLWITSVLFSHAWNCWARGVRVKKCGRFPVYAGNAKWCEIRECVFDDAWFKGGGGTAYAGWDRCWDCLMERVETFKLRHAPLVQWGASGCVIRDSVFHDSDAQWHSGWTHENLMENCRVESVVGNGGYGYGMWASPPEDIAHGPNGPRNVVYHCDVSSPKAGVWMGGMNENWLILYSRFTVAEGPGVVAKSNSFDHIVRGNVFVLKDPASPMIQMSPDCSGALIIANVLVGGNGKLLGGGAVAERLTGNRVARTSSPRPPSPPVPSIYLWQLEQKKSADGTIKTGGIKKPSLRGTQHGESP